MCETNKEQSGKLTSYCGYENADGYAEYIKGKIKDAEKIREQKWTGCKYVDPDSTYKKEENEYYKRITEFLNARESWLHCNDNDERPVWEFEFKKGKSKEGAGIEVRVRDTKEVILCLRTDQFGFTAPSGKGSKTRDPKHPYARILEMCKYTNEKCDFVANIVYNTRTIGGSFVWPLTEGRTFTQYNSSRGIDSNIEERVDITLYEIMHFYEWIERKAEDKTIEYLYKNDLLFTSEMEDKKKGIGTKKDNSSMETWLRHFGSFENYIDFFLLNDFVTEVATKGPGKKYRPINIFEKRDRESIYVKCDSYKPILFEMVRTSTCGELVNMLTNLSDLILKRSKRMEYCIGCKGENCANCDIHTKSSKDIHIGTEQKEYQNVEP